MNYGIPYLGSKSRIAKEILLKLKQDNPECKRLVDLFGGGGAITHCASAYNFFNNILYNDINKSLKDFVEYVFNNNISDYPLLYQWIDRETFFKEKENSPFIKYIWSFSNNGQDYLYSKNIEPVKKSIFNAVVNNIYDDFYYSLNIPIIKSNEIKDRWKEYLTYMKSIDEGKFKQTLNKQQSLVQMFRLLDINCFNNIEFISIDYKNFIPLVGDVIYCDIPYLGTACKSYSKKETGFKHDDFFAWCKAQKVPVYVSSYNIGSAGFECVWYKDIHVLSSSRGSEALKTEKLFRCDT